MHIEQDHDRQGHLRPQHMGREATELHNFMLPCPRSGGDAEDKGSTPGACFGGKAHAVAGVAGGGMMAAGSDRDFAAGSVHTHLPASRVWSFVQGSGEAAVDDDGGRDNGYTLLVHRVFKTLIEVKHDSAGWLRFQVPPGLRVSVEG